MNNTTDQPAPEVPTACNTACNGCAYSSEYNKPGQRDICSGCSRNKTVKEDHFELGQTILHRIEALIVPNLQPEQNVQTLKHFIIGYLDWIINRTTVPPNMSCNTVAWRMGNNQAKDDTHRISP